jgi:hypothetical protein
MPALYAKQHRSFVSLVEYVSWLDSRLRGNDGLIIIWVEFSLLVQRQVVIKCRWLNQTRPAFRADGIGQTLM